MAAKIKVTRERAVEAFWLLNDLIGDLIGATQAFRYFDTSTFKTGATQEVLRIYNKMADSFLFLALAKWIEYYDFYNVLIPKDLRPTCKQLRKELDKRGVREFRNKVVGHIWDRKHLRPMLPNEIDELDRKITNGNAAAFLQWVNNPNENRLGLTIVGTIEAVRDAIKVKWLLSDDELRHL